MTSQKLEAPDYSRHDTLLARMQPYGCVLKNGLSNHVPMVVEALAALGQSARAEAWLAQNEHSVLPRPPSQAPINRGAWREALADATRFSDWADCFLEEIEADGWQATVAHWVPDLTPGFFSAACHGVIRTGHAVRALTFADTKPRRRELADALASWCVSFQTLADQQAAPALGAYNGDVLLKRLPLLPSSLRKNDGAITRAVAALAGHPGFFDHVQALRFGDPHAATGEVACSAAHVLLHNASQPLGAIVFTHAITGTLAARHLLPYLPETARRPLVQAAFLTVAALHAAYADNPLGETATPAAPPTAPPNPPMPQTLVHLAAQHGDDHVIKVTEACTTLYACTGEPALLAAADRVRTLLPSQG